MADSNILRNPEEPTEDVLEQQQSASKEASEVEAHALPIESDSVDAHEQHVIIDLEDPDDRRS